MIEQKTKMILVALVMFLVTATARAEQGSVFVLAQPVGFSLGFASVSATAGVSMGYHLTDKSFVAVDFNHTHPYLGSDYSTRVVADAFGVDYGYYLLPKLVLRGGPRVKSVQVSKKQYSSDPLISSEAVRYEAKFAVATFWRSGAFMFGADWVSLAIPLKTSVASNPQGRDFSSNEVEILKIWLGANF